MSWRGWLIVMAMLATEIWLVFDWVRPDQGLDTIAASVGAAGSTMTLIWFAKRKL